MEFLKKYWWKSQKRFAPLIIIVIATLIIGAGVSGFLVLREKKTSPPQPSSQSPQPQQPQQSPLQSNGISVKSTNAKYKTVQTKPTGWFTTGQDADIMLSGIDFNNAGGPLLFNHPGGIASDGTRFLLADRNNNRVLIWNKLPTGNTAPDLVLGQPDFTANNPGTGLYQLNWPVSVAAANGKIIVADTYNDRILIWNSFPTKNGQQADIEIKDEKNIAKRNVGWPWAVWTDGEKLIITATSGSRVLIWNSFPSENNQEADIVLTANGNFGTPRSIASDGKHLMIGDHNVKLVQGRPGNFFWKTFPNQDDQPYDFFVGEVYRMGEGRRPDNAPLSGDVLWGGMTSDGKLIATANMLYVWDSFPENEQDAADLKAGGTPATQGYDFGGAQAGMGAVVAGGKLYISLSNGNKIVGFNSMPTRSDQEPDFAIGAPDIYTNTLQTNSMITNGVPATDGTSLFVSSDFDRKLYVWKNLPDASAAQPDFIYNVGGWDNALHNGVFAQVNQREVYIWTKTPRNGELADIMFLNTIGTLQLQDVRGVAMDDKYFYLADSATNKIYVWEGLPASDKPPKYTLTTDQPRRLSSDGKHLVVTATLSNETGHIKIFLVDSLSNSAQPVVVRLKNFRTNLPESAFAASGHLFVADTPFNRVLVWKGIDDALAGNDPDVILGAETLVDTTPEIGRNKLFWPAGLAFDGSFLWVGEFKFSGRLLRFSVQP